MSFRQTAIQKTDTEEDQVAKNLKALKSIEDHLNMYIFNGHPCEMEVCKFL